MAGLEAPGTCWGRTQRWRKAGCWGHWGGWGNRQGRPGRDQLYTCGRRRKRPHHQVRRERGPRGPCPWLTWRVVDGDHCPLLLRYGLHPAAS